MIGENNFVILDGTIKDDVQNGPGFGIRCTGPENVVQNTELAGLIGRRRGRYTLNNRLIQSQMRGRTQVERTRSAQAADGLRVHLVAVEAAETNFGVR